MHQQTTNNGSPTAPPDEGRTIRHFAYVNRPFRDVRRSVAAAPERVLAAPPDPTAGDSLPRAELRVRWAGMDLSRDVRMILGDVQVGVHDARVPIRWVDATHPGLFPMLDATLEVTPVAAGRHGMTQLGLLGRYQPPFGRLGALADGLAGHAIIVESVDRYLDDLVDRFHATLPVPVPGPEDEGEAGPGGPEVPGGRRIILPVEGLDRVPGGAAGLALRLQGEPGVLNASVNPGSGLAVIDYEEACSVAGLVRLVETD